VQHLQSQRWLGGLVKLNVPLSARCSIVKGVEKLRIWYNGKERIVDTKIRPYFYSYRDLDIECFKKEKVKAKALSDHQEKTFWKYSFNTRAELRAVSGKPELKEDIFENELSEYGDSFIIRNRLDRPNVFELFPHKNELILLFVDIEQENDKGIKFPTGKNNLSSIAWCTNDRDVKCILKKKESESDKLLLENFIDEYAKINPDVVVCYNKTYDIPMIIRRCIRNNIDTSPLTKNQEGRANIGKKEMAFLDGIVIYDVYDSARQDQALDGNVENRGLKEVSNFFGFEEKRKPLTYEEISEKIGTKELAEYNMDDVKRLFYLFDIYWPGIEYNANDLKIPLSIAVAMNITKLGMICIGEEYKKQNIIADGTNEQRYDKIFRRKKKAGEPNYQGALVGIDRNGYFEPVYKADYGSMYPTIMSSFNLSPDTTKLLEYVPYGKFKIEEEEMWFVYHIPDDVLKMNLIIQVSKRPGFFALLVKKFLLERMSFKNSYKKTGLERYKSASDNRKVKANGGVYGNQGAAHHPFGFAPIAIATCGFGREAAQMLIDVLNGLYPNSVIETDTDGIYFTTKNFNEEDVMDAFKKKLKQVFKKDISLDIDIDKYDSGYFYKAKNYVLKKGDKIIKHGVAMKAQSKNILSRNLIEELAKAKVNNQPITKVSDNYMKLDFPLEHFAMNVTMGMPYGSYKNKEGNLVTRLARDAERIQRIEPAVGNRYYYVKEKHDYVLLEEASIERLDITYYREQVKRILKMFDVSLIATKLDDWLK